MVDAAHFGCWSRYEVGYDILHNADNLFVDASSSQFFLGQRRTVELARMWGTDRIMFGSDYPCGALGGIRPVRHRRLLGGRAGEHAVAQRERFAGVKVG